MKFDQDRILEWTIITVMAERTPPSVWAVAFATALIAGITGYYLGQASSIGIFSSNGPPQKQAAEDSEEISDESESEVEEEISKQELNSFENADEECKLVLVVRTDLGMTKGACSVFPPVHLSLHYGAICFVEPIS